jgi:hypothetical protein
MAPSTKYYYVLEKDGVAGGSLDFSSNIGSASAINRYTSGVWSATNLYSWGAPKMTFVGGRVYQPTITTGTSFVFQNVPGFGGSNSSRPAILSKLDGVVTTTASIGNIVSLVISGTLTGFTSLTAGLLYQFGPDGTIEAGSSGSSKQLGRALTAIEMLIRLGSY